MNTNNEMEMEIFRAGKYGAKGSYSKTDLQRMADDYRPDLLEAPLTFDHAQTGPAYGWVDRVRREGDRLVAVLKGVPEAVRQLMKTGAYKRRSVELFRRLPHTGRPYLRAVSLLGAATPEVKGLRDVCFASANETERLELPDGSVEPLDSNAELEPESATDQSSNNMETRMTTLFSDLRADGYCLAQSDADAIQRLVLAACNAPVAAEFSENAVAESLDWLTGFLQSTLLRAPLGTANRPGNSAGAQSIPGAIGFNECLDAGSVALHNSALLLQRDSPGLAYRDALTQASRRA